MEMLDKTTTSQRFFESDLFAAVQSAQLFPDSKSFADAIPNKGFDEIEQDWQKTSGNADFDLNVFVQKHFTIPAQQDAKPGEDSADNALGYIQGMWQQLLRTPDDETNSSLIPLPHAYIVPGGRFREIYYWDTYFTALGLCEDGHYSLVLDMFKNFQYLIHNNGCIPNGNRDYYRGRTQPPIMALLLELLVVHKQRLPELQSPDFLPQAVASLEQEYKYWMRHQENLDETCRTSLRCVRMPDGAVLNRYWDEHTGPRPESWREDKHLAEQIPDTSKADFYTNIRAACESGWDFSSRWLEHPDNLNSIRTTDIVPVDLNSLLWKLETCLAQQCETLGDDAKAQGYKLAAQSRADAIQRWCWQEQSGFFMDCVFSHATTSPTFSLAGVVPLFMGLASQDQADKVADRLANEFLMPGGLVTTLTSTEQQWDSPNGWAPLQWFAVIALENYGYTQLAQQIMQNWVSNVELCLEKHGCMLEKYNVLTPGLVAGGGEYQVQTGFGWTNGVTRAFYKKTR